MVEPPWIKYPQYPPYDTFWRQSGQHWLAYVWEPFLRGLSKKDQDEYLRQWKPPRAWIDFYFNTQWLDDNDK